MQIVNDYNSGETQQKIPLNWFHFRRASHDRIYQTYDAFGSTLLQPIADKFGIPFDHFNWCTAQIFALILSIFFRKFANNKHCSPTTRHILTIIPGIGISLFCFGIKQTVYVLTIPTSCLIAFKVLPSGPASHFSLILPMGWLATIFWNRFMHQHPDVYPLDYSALTQFG